MRNHIIRNQTGVLNIQYTFSKLIHSCLIQLDTTVKGHYHSKVKSWMHPCWIKVLISLKIKILLTPNLSTVVYLVFQVFFFTQKVALECIWYKPQILKTHKEQSFLSLQLQMFLLALIIIHILWHNENIWSQKFNKIFRFRSNLAASVMVWLVPPSLWCPPLGHGPMPACLRGHCTAQQNKASTFIHQIHSLPHIHN